MEIQLCDYDEILKEMVAERWAGREYVVFPCGNGPVALDDLITFDDIYETQQFCNEMSTDLVQYKWLTIRPVYKCMLEALYIKSRLIEKDGIVDISSMVGLYNTRLSDKN